MTFSERRQRCSRRPLRLPRVSLRFHRSPLNRMRTVCARGRRWGSGTAVPHTVCIRKSGARGSIFSLVDGANESPPPRWAPAERKSKPVSHSTHTKAVHAVSSSNVLEEAKALQEKITTLVGPAPALTKADIQRSAKLRKGGAAVVKTVAALSDKFGLVVPSQPTSTMVEKINQAESLVALHQE